MIDSDKPYENREIDALAKGLHDKLDSYQAINEEKFDSIIEQTTKHNGRMTKLEDKQSDFTSRLDFFRGVLTSMGILFSIVIVPILAWALIKLVNLDSTVADISSKSATTAIMNVLANYNIENK